MSIAEACAGFGANANHTCTQLAQRRHGETEEDNGDISSDMVTEMIGHFFSEIGVFVSHSPKSMIDRGQKGMDICV